MNRLFKQLLLVICLIIGVLTVNGCANYTPDTEYSSQGSRPKSDSLVVPPNLSAPQTNQNYKMIKEDNNAKYALSSIKGMRIEQGGSERWLVIESKTVDNVWPMVTGFLSQAGLTVKYQNKRIGVIQTDWATRNNVVSQTGIRAFFEWVGWGEMYTMPTQYMFRVTLWQNGSNVQMFVTDVQMIEVYPGCKQILNSTQEISDRQITTWMPLPPNPQLELEFLMQFMASTGSTPQQIKVVRNNLQIESAAAFKAATRKNGAIIINDQFDRAWWRTGLALDRVGLGVADKNREAGEYYVYSLQSQVNAPEEGFLSRMFSSSSGTNLKIPKAQYIVKLTPDTTNPQNTVLTMSPMTGESGKNTTDDIKKYMDNLAKQLY